MPSARLSAVALAVLVVAPVILISRKYVHFMPSSWWLSDALIPAVVFAIGIPIFWIVRGLGEPDGPVTSPSGIPDNAFVFNIIPAIAYAGLIFASIYITLPAALSLVFGGETTHQVTAATNIVGSVDRPQWGCLNRSVIDGRLWQLYESLCFDSKNDKRIAQSMGPRVSVELKGWGNNFGIFYTSTNPIGPAK